MCNLSPSLVLKIVVIARKCIALNLNTLSSIAPFLNLAYKDEERIGRDMLSGYNT